MLEPGQAVWKVGPDYVDIIQTTLNAEEARLFDTSSRRRRVQQAGSVDVVAVETDATVGDDQAPAEPEVVDDSVHAGLNEDQSVLPAPPEEVETDDAGWGWDMPPNVIDTRHSDVVQAAAEGRFSEAAELAVIGEREDITAYGLHSAQAAAWLSTRARVAEVSGRPDQARELRATVARMGKDDVEWCETKTTDSAEPAWHSVPPQPVAETKHGDDQPAASRRRVWPVVATVAALSLTGAGVWQHAHDQQDAKDRQQKAAAYKGRSGATLRIDGVSADVVAQWSSDRDHVVVELRSYFDRNARFLRIDESGKSAQNAKGKDFYPKDPEISLPVTDPLADVTVRMAVGGRAWKEGPRAASRNIRLSPTGVAYDAETGEALPSDLG